MQKHLKLDIADLVHFYQILYSNKVIIIGGWNPKKLSPMAKVGWGLFFVVGFFRFFGLHNIVHNFKHHF